MAGMLMRNTILKQAEAQIEKGVAPVQRQNYEKILTAGMKVALNKGPNGLLGQLTKSQDVITEIVNGAIGIVGILRKESQGTMPVAAMVPATMALVIHGLDFAEQAGLIKVGRPELEQATQLCLETMMQRMGLTPEKVQKLAEGAQGVMNDPEKVAQIKKQIGGEDVAA